MIRNEDLKFCRAAIKTGSLSFHAASYLLPRHVRDPALALYAFCRMADDAVDLVSSKQEAVDLLRERLEAAYSGVPADSPADRAFTAVIEEFEIPRALPDALLEGLEWDAQGRQHQTISELKSYSARVASAVGAMFCLLMRVRDRDALARACDLGVAMQLTNIARDVGEDVHAGRLYLPLDWLKQADIDPEDLLANPQPTEALGSVVQKLLEEANRLYRRSEAGIAALPLVCRPGIFASRYIYAGIGGQLRRSGYDPITQRARTSGRRKIMLLGWSAARTAGTAVLPQSPMIYASPLPEVVFLIEAAAVNPKPEWGDTVTGVLARLAARDQELYSNRIEQ
ncbi:MAG: phytoene/squalene synthase family protein [Rhodobacteraceae bacterium]|nr:phytoene/squalene synthase family protein [Paracoccaceae bacterium]MCY4197711.1 phytoene/squalene synthase family protein [Paracoccaceae bacterium]